VVELARQPGARENRWAHLLSGAPAPEVLAASAAPVVLEDEVTLGELAALKANVARLEGEIESLKTTVAKLCTEFGITAR
jgi:uncharacterized protein YceH (UPF0502 family)